MEIFLFWIFLAAAVIAVLKLFSLPVKLIFKFLGNALIGLVLLILINMFGAYIGLTLPVNFITASAAGILGLPGVLLLLAVQWLIL